MSPTDFIHPYVDPGVYIEEIPYPVITNPALTPTVLALVGETQGYRETSEIVAEGLTGTTPYQLAQLGVDMTTVVVKNNGTDPATFGTVYAVSTPAGQATPTTQNDFRLLQQGSVAETKTTTIQRESGGTIPAGTPLLVTYRYTDAAQYNIVGYNDYDDVRDRYGEAFDSAGAIHSQLTLGARLAFANGADLIVLVPVKPTTPGQAATNDDWTDAISGLAAETEVNAVAILNGTSAVHDIARQHVVQMESQGQLRIAFVGRDGSTVTSSNLEAEALAHGSSRMVLVGPAQFEMNNNIIPNFVVGGQYAAAAAAGSFASRPPQEPLTHKQIFGFTGVNNQNVQSDILAMQSSGVLVIYERRDGLLIVKHGLTTKTAPSTGGDAFTEELSIVAARDRLRDLIQSTLEDSGLIGGILTSTTPDLVLAAVTGALELASSAELIQDYADLKYRQPADQPSVVQVRFSYQPTLALNYIQVQFALNPTTGEVNFSDTGTNDDNTGA